MASCHQADDGVLTPSRLGRLVPGNGRDSTSYRLRVNVHPSWAPAIRRLSRAIGRKSRTGGRVCHTRHTQITVRVARDRRWHDVLHFLRHHADVRRVPADVGEAVIAQAVVEASQQHDVILQPYVGANGNV